MSAPSDKKGSSENIISGILLVFIILVTALGSGYITSKYIGNKPASTITTTVADFEVTTTVQVPVAVVVTSYVSQTVGSTSPSLSSLSSSSSSSFSSSQTSSSSSSTSNSSLLPIGPLNVVVNQVITDTVEYQSNGYVYWLLNLTVTDAGTDQYEVDPYSFQLTSTGHVVYSAQYASADQNDLQSVTLLPGGHTTGQIAFKLPDGEKPAQLTYLYAFGFAKFVVTNIPAPSGNASHVQAGSVKNSNGTFSSYLGAYASIANSSSYFYTGNMIAVKIVLNNYYSGLNSNVTVTSITDSDTGFTTTGLSQSLPITVEKSEVDLVLYLKAPSFAFNGQLMNITIETSS